MKKKVFLKNFLPLIIALVGAFVFFASYNRYLLDSSLVNLKLSLRKLGNVEGVEGLSEVREIEGILDAAFLMESTKEEFDLASALQLEMEEELIEEVSLEKQEQNRRYVETMSAAAEIDAVRDIAAGISKSSQIEDVRHIIQEVVTKKQKKKPFLLSKLDDFIIAVTPSKERGDLRNLSGLIERKKKKAASLSGDKLQEEYLKIAQLYLRLKDYGNSLAYINKTIKVDPKSPQALTAKFYSGILYKAKKDFKRAGSVFRNIKKDLPEEWEGFSTYQEASSLYSLEETKEAIHLFESNFDENPSQSTRQLSQFRAGYIYLYDLEDPKASYEAFKKLRDKARSSAYAEYYEKKVNRDVSGFYGYEGFKLLKEGYKTLNPDKYTEALAQFDLALKITYDLDLAYCGKSLAYNLLERSDDSLKTAQMTKQLSSNSADTVTVLGYIYYSLGMNDKAISEYQAAAKLKPNLVIPQYNLGTLHLLKKDYRKAKKHLKLTIKADPSFAQAYNNLGYVYWLENNYKSARKNFRQAISLDPDLVEPKYNLGVVLVALGEYEKARKEFSEVEGLQSGYRRTAYYLNMIKKRLGY